MAVSVALVGFGDDRPPAFADGSQIDVAVDGSVSIEALLHQIDLGATMGLALLLNGKVVPQPDRSSILVQDGDLVTVMLALEGG